MVSHKCIGIKEMRQQYKYDIWPLKFESIIAHLLLLAKNILEHYLILTQPEFHDTKYVLWIDTLK